MTLGAERAGLSPERLARIDSRLKRSYVDSGKIAGALTLVHRKGETADCSPLGLADRERGVPMAADTIFRIDSMTKPITSVALMTLFEHGLFQLDDPVHRFLPACRDVRVHAAGKHPQFVTEPCRRAVTVRDLLTHTSGLGYGFMERTNVDHAYRKLGLGSFEKGFRGGLAAFVDPVALRRLLPARVREEDAADGRPRELRAPPPVAVLRRWRRARLDSARCSFPRRRRSSSAALRPCRSRVLSRRRAQP